MIFIAARTYRCAVNAANALRVLDRSAFYWLTPVTMFKVYSASEPVVVLCSCHELIPEDLDVITSRRARVFRTDC